MLFTFFSDLEDAWKYFPPPPFRATEVRSIHGKEGELVVVQALCWKALVANQMPSRYETEGTSQRGLLGWPESGSKCSCLLPFRLSKQLGAT